MAKSTATPTLESAPLSVPVRSGAASTSAATMIPARASMLVGAARSLGNQPTVVLPSATLSKNSATKRTSTPTASAAMLATTTTGSAPPTRPTSPHRGSRTNPVSRSV